ncbi:MAG TPA: CPBP family intramembrane glutamic endopeptidase [Bryobacteraceae bacterium]|nr:CPBP family intramembrane glutamic endopeptidase [Bryobacteraceae bacterium]
MTPSPPPSKLGIALRVGLYALIGWLTLVISATLMVWILGRRDTLFVIAALSGFAAAAVANAIVVRIYERGRLSDLGLGWTSTALREFLTGAGLAAGAATLILAGSWAVRAAHFERVPGSEHPWSSLIFVSIVLLFGAAGEEMLFHGYAFQLLIRSLGAFATILPVSIIFGLAHLGNQNSSKLAIFNTILWGILLGYAYWRTRALWLPIGLHFGWNFALPLFGVNLSGFTMNVMGYALRWRAGDLWSGGDYGLEGSVLTTAVVVVLFFAVHRVFPERLQE